MSEICFSELLCNEFCRSLKDKKHLDLEQIIYQFETLEDLKLTDIQKLELTKHFINAIFIGMNNFGINVKEFRAVVRGIESELLMINTIQ